MELPWGKKKVEEAAKTDKLESNIVLPEEPAQQETMKAVAPMTPAVMEPIKIDEPKNPVVDAFTLAMFVWVMYKLNIITRIQVRDFLDIIRKGEWPKDVVKYLMDEVRKLS